MWSLLTNKWLIGGIVVAGLGLALWLQTERLDAAKAGREAAELVATQWQANAKAIEAVNAENVKQMAALKADRDRIERLANDARAAAAELQDDYDTLRRTTRNVAPENDGPLAPVLAATLDGLRRIEAGAAGTPGHHEDRVRPANPAR